MLPLPLRYINYFRYYNHLKNDKEYEMKTNGWIIDAALYAVSNEQFDYILHYFRHRPAYNQASEKSTSSRYISYLFEYIRLFELPTEKNL